MPRRSWSIRKPTSVHTARPASEQAPSLSDHETEVERTGRVERLTNGTTVMPFTAGHRSVIYSPKRVDFDPDGERNCEKRGESGYEPVSWDEALDIVCKEINRVRRI
jgi:anaerobic selenocysteine-containing dehydrogenase